MGVNALPVVQVAAIEEQSAEHRWLVRNLWAEQAVGFIGGAPKSCKSWLGLDLAISVASGTPSLDRFAVQHRGPSLVYLAEDALVGVRERVAAICAHRGLDLAELDLHVVTASSLRLDLEKDRNGLEATIARLKPRLLVLDPLVRLHRLDENSAAEISGLLGYLREVNRRHQVAIALVHHMSKRPRAQLGQALRGSGDLHAWTDSACYLVRRGKQLELSVEHRSAPAPDPFGLRLVDDEGRAHLEPATSGEPSPATTPLLDVVQRALRDADQPRTRAALRAQLRVNNHRLGEALLALEQQGLANRSTAGWQAVLPTTQLPAHQ